MTLNRDVAALPRYPIVTGTSILATTYKDGVLIACDTLGEMRLSLPDSAIFDCDTCKNSIKQYMANSSSFHGYPMTLVFHTLTASPKVPTAPPSATSLCSVSRRSTRRSQWLLLGRSLTSIT